MGKDEALTMRAALRELTYSEARLLVVDDDPAMVMFLQGLLERAGYTQLISTTDPREVVPLCEETAPDLVLIHDAARPDCPPDVVQRLLTALAEQPGAIPVLPVVDSLEAVPHGGTLEELEAHYIREVLRTTRGNYSRAAAVYPQLAQRSELVAASRFGPPAADAPR